MPNRDRFSSEESGIAIVDDRDDMVFDWSCSSQSLAIRQALNYWNALRGNHRMPARRKIAAAGIRELLPVVQLYDLMKGGSAYRVRLLGSAVRGVFKADPTGTLFDASSDHRLVLRMLTVFGLLAKYRRPLIVRARRTAIESLSFAPIESLFLPLSDDGVDVDASLVVSLVPHFLTVSIPDHES